MDFIARLAAYDTQFFLFLNSFHNNFFDGFMMVFSNSKVWIPFYMVVVYLLLKNEGKKAWWLILFFAVTILFSDQLSVLIKNLVERPRPTHNISISNFVHSVNNYKGGMYGFVSSHAANTIAFALLSSLFVRKRIYTFTVLFWVVITCYSRVYLGVHYPLDLLGGLIVGVFASLFVYVLIRKIKPDVLPQNSVKVMPAVIVLWSTIALIAVYSALF